MLPLTACPRVRATWILPQGDTADGETNCGWIRFIFQTSFMGVMKCCNCRVCSPSRRRSWTPKRVMGAASLLHLLSIPRLRWSSSNEDDDKVSKFSVQKLYDLWFCPVLWTLCYDTCIFHCYQIELTRAEVESLRSEIADADERESQLKARYDWIPPSFSIQYLVSLFVRVENEHGHDFQLNQNPIYSVFSFCQIW
jgi:hypothetical protein